MKKDLGIYLKPGKYVDSDSPVVFEKAEEINRSCSSDEEKVIKIHKYVRDLPFDIGYGFKMLLSSQKKASDFIKEGRGFCMHKAVAFLALCRASHIPARIVFQIVESSDKPFHPEPMRKMYGEKPQPWYSVGEVYLHGRWIKAYSTVDKEQGERHGKKVSDFDGAQDFYTVEGPILKERGSATDMPEAILHRHRQVAAVLWGNLASGGKPSELFENIVEGETDDLELTLPEE